MHINVGRSCAHSAPRTFEQWMQEVDRILYQTIGCFHDDLPDTCYVDMFDAGRSPAHAAKRAIRDAQ